MESSAISLDRLLWLKRMTLWQGQLYDEQVFHLHQWLAMLFGEYVEEFKLEFDGEQRKLQIACNGQNWKLVPPNLKERLEHFQAWVKELLGDDFVVTFIGLTPPPKKTSPKKKTNAKRKPGARRRK